MEAEPTVGSTILQYFNEAKDAKRRRMEKNKENFDTYNLNADFSHKIEGQSTEFLPKQQMAVEQLVSFLTQGLIDKTGWFDVQYRDNFQSKILTADQWKKIIEFFLDKVQFDAFIQDSFKMGLLGALMISKVDGCFYEDMKYEVTKEFGLFGKKKLIRNKKKYWKPKIDLVRQEDFFPDPTGRNLYVIEVMEMDWYELYQEGLRVPSEYDRDVIDSLSGVGNTDQDAKKARETGQDNFNKGGRRIVRIIEIWGTVYGEDGMPLFENSICKVTEDGRIIQHPKKIDLWDGEHPYVDCPIVRVPKSRWHRALMDSSTRTNLAMNEIYNLMVDGSIMSVFGIKQVRSQWLSNPEEIDEGIAPGKTLEVNSSMPPGAKVIERIDTGAVGPEAFNMFNIMDREHQGASMTSDIRMGNLAQRQVKATEIVASTQAASGIQTGFVKYVEKNYLEKALHKFAMRIAENISRLNPDELDAILGTEQASILRSFSDEEIFAEFANGSVMQVFGMTTVMNRVNDFHKITSLLQVVGASPDLMREFQLSFSTAKMLGEIIKSLNIDVEKIKASPEEQQRAKEMIMAQYQAMAGKQGQPANGQSQVPDASTPGPQNAHEEMQSAIQHGIPHKGMAG